MEVKGTSEEEGEEGWAKADQVTVEEGWAKADQNGCPHSLLDTNYYGKPGDSKTCGREQ